MYRKELEIQKGIDIQTEQLGRWKQVLKPEVFENLKAWATEKNHEKASGYDVVRGSSLDNYIANYANDFTPPN